jgi:hypothetical protein
MSHEGDYCVGHCLNAFAITTRWLAVQSAKRAIERELRAVADLASSITAGSPRERRGDSALCYGRSAEREPVAGGRPTKHAPA